ncbi:MAG: L,D-transpeptidase [Mariprofundaceae bacterium]|nr:L,D-transpeptidase [Mariprofundaceae bacterium]
MIVISIGKQMLYHRRKTGVCRSYPVSTARRGAGNQSGSLQTPLGKHRIHAKIGQNMPLYTAFTGRVAVGIYDSQHEDASHDWILTRILWLEGMQTGKNKRGCVDTRSRYIYIHGTHAETDIGTAASHGCIRMHNDDILNLFTHAHEGESVYIRR